MKRAALTSQKARAMNAARATRAGGRPRKARVQRCPCRVMTLKRAAARGKEAAHMPGCSFNPEAATLCAKP